MNNVKEFFFEKSKYFHQYFVNCVQFHKWYQNNFLTGMNTLYFTILRKIMRNKNRSRHLKKMQFMVAVYFLLKIWIYKFYNSFCIPESQSLSNINHKLKNKKLQPPPPRCNVPDFSLWWKKQHKLIGLT